MAIVAASFRKGNWKEKQTKESGTFLVLGGGGEGGGGGSREEVHREAGRAANLLVIYVSFLCAIPQRNSVYREELLEGSLERQSPFRPLSRLPPFLSLESTRRNLLRGICMYKLLSSSFHFLSFMTV